MAFQIKDFASVVVSSINWMRATTKKVTDFNVGSVVRTMIEAVAAEIEQLYMKMYIGLKEAIPVSVYNSFDFTKLPAATAVGLVRVTITSSTAATVIPGGTTFTATGKTAPYFSSQDVTIAAGNTFADVPVACSVRGAVGNLNANTAFTLGPAPAGFVSAVNQAAFVGGADEETDQQRKLRFNAYIAALARSTVQALIYGAKTTARTDSSGNVLERVTTAVVIEPWVLDNTQPVGWAKIYVHNGTGVTSGALVSLAHDVLYGYTDATGKRIPGWKAAGTQLDVLAATDQSLAVTGTITSAPGYVHAQHLSDANAAIAAYLAGLDIGAVAVRAKLIQLVMDLEGVTNFTMSAPAGDTTPASTAKILPGVITLT